MLLLFFLAVPLKYLHSLAVFPGPTKQNNTIEITTQKTMTVQNIYTYVRQT